MKSRAISVTGGSVQLQLKVSDELYLVDVWSVEGRWKWSARAASSMEPAQGVRARWSDARTAAFRACVKHAKESHGKAG